MSTRVLTAPYGRAALDALTAVVAEAKCTDPMAPVTVLVPTNVAGIVARRHLALGLRDGAPGVAALTVTTLPRLAEQVAAARMDPRRPATQPVLAAAWRQALDQDPGVFAPVTDHPATIRALVAAHRELRDLSPGGRARARDSTGLSADLIRLHEQVVALTDPVSYDATDLLREATRLVEQGAPGAAPLGAVVLFLPQRLTRAESGLARALAGTSDCVVVAGMTGVRRADSAVRHSLDLMGLAVPEETAVPRPVASRVLHASDADDEVRCVVREVVATLDRTPAHRVAILYGARVPYARQLHEHLEASGLTVNGPATRAVQERAIARGLLGILDAGRTGLGRADTFTALAEAPVLAFSDRRVPVSRWERISRRAGIVGRGDWRTRTTTFIADQLRLKDQELAQESPREGLVAAADREIGAAGAMLEFVYLLEQRFEEAARISRWQDLRTWALDLLHDLYGTSEAWAALPAEEQYAAVAVESAIHGLAALDAFELPVDVETLAEILAVELESSLPRVGRYGEGVFVGPVSAAVGMDLDEVFVLGLSEDSFPGRLHEDALLSDTLRTATGELDPLRSTLDDKQRHLLAALAAAPRSTASFPRGDLRRSTTRIPSQFLLPSLRELTGNKELAATEWDRPDKHRASTDGLLVGSRSFADGILTTDLPASEQEWQIRAAASGTLLAPEPAALLSAARALIDARASTRFTRYDGNLAGAAGLPDYAHSDQVVSPTALESYARCPFAYFVQRLLRVEPLEQPEEIVQISAAEIGTLVHGALDALITESAGAGTLPSYAEPWTASQHQRLQELVTERAIDLVERGLTGHRRLWEAELDALRQVVARMLVDDDVYRARRDAEVVRSELEFGIGSDRDPVAVALPDGRLLMRGSADKVDRTRDGVLLVTDVKTGRADPFRELGQDPVAAGTKLQLPVYALAARERVADKPVTGVEAMYWFVRRNAGERIPVTLDDDLEARYAQTLQTLVDGIAAGVFIGRPSAQPAYGFVECEFCTPGGLGHKEARQRYEDKRSDAALVHLIELVDPEALA
ncbi:PD-(D/E)XK nuclease family protein [Mumia sp. zg.B21]|uniref:PD-(D/E)XK nuclease family protein n=1 Tax=Mumia sp. zg.B21 TaxID=2855447 RepID=UPI001C6E96EC|nr:PD-(D/E)XK nuclease family protein [Mumia sp. zg.B21]MBW9208678.1 PD-(D/E)XK nuclease family protein [Mumia sp. zg.B21]